MRAYTPHALSAPMYELVLDTATATGSITDSTAQDENGTSASELKASQAHICAKESCVPGLASGNG